MKSIAFILRERREALWRRWADSLEDQVNPDYRDLIASPLGDRMLRSFIDDLVAYTEAEDYEAPAVLKKAENKAQLEAEHRLFLEFDLFDLVAGLQVLRGAILDALGDALVQGDLPPVGETLDQLKVVDAYIDRLVCATFAAGQ